ncbi:DUF4864 domain-containing protein [Donghicola sp. C2-DW-16]|uniref:DUF4864 domain-containing protein n=1 Tax=Donghicola mangrovi TaxID=2729614 RepID=A0A850QDG1_9RHOB|nr:DUF4864 domain-containing protein [Donghicola mangrovi]NVO24930.1 DUF4864 domain-containing protein [Donghicola mangrovi]NVO28108.1 DUF4864 domain-containing protein [Donghicola mangrovi]
MKTLIIAAALWLGTAIGAVAQQDDIRQTIRNQLDAFKSDDLATAFTFASPTIQGIFRSPEMFGHMVQNGYPMVWRPGTVVFLGLAEREGTLFQTVVIEDRSGKAHTLEYKMIQIDGRWQIDGVRLLAIDGAIA